MTQGTYRNTSMKELKAECSISSKNLLKVSHLNVENLRVHKESVFSLFQDAFFDVIAISETFLKPIVLSEPFVIDGYNFVRHDRENKEGGGVAVYLKKSLNYKVIATSQAIYCKKPEFIVLEISQGWKLLLCIVYRPPKTGYISELFDVISSLLPVYNNVLILGDFNTDLNSNRNFYDKNELLNLVGNLNLSILRMEPTYHLPTSDSLLDIIISNDEQRIRTYGQIPVSGVSYHDLIFVELNLKSKLVENRDFITIRDYKNLDVESLRQDCSLLRWDDVFSCNNINRKIDLFLSKISRLFSKHIPERKISKKRQPCPWVNVDIKKLMSDRDIVYKRYVRTKDPVVWESYRLLRNRIKRLIRDERNRYFQNNFQSYKSNKDLWKLLKTEGAGKIPKQMSDPVVNLDDLNNFFCGINNEVNNGLIDYYSNARVGNVHHSFKFSEISQDVIYRALMDISSNAVGYDGVQIKFLRLIFNEIRHVLCHIFNYSFVKSEYPLQWKKALILPLPKVPNPLECKNYRSINILSVLGKVLDKLAYKQICNFVNENNILYKYQSGYRKAYSTQTALINVVDDVRSAMDQRKVTLLVLLDFSRAFDCVNHNILLSILKSYNFSDKVVKWFASYLVDRIQCVKTVAGKLSDWKKNLVGVPQGSTLSALLFSLYINRISDKVIFCKSALYADDMQLYIHCNIGDINAAIQSMNADLLVLHNWCKDHGLSLNINKCKPIILGTSRMLTNLNQYSILPVSINGELLEFEKTVLNLGLRITENLSWNNQVNYVYKKVYQSIYQFRRLSFQPTLQVKKLLVQSLIFPVFDYANVVYCDLNETLTNRLQRAQNACIRYIFNLKIDDHVTRYYKQLGWLKIKEQREYNVLALAYKIINNKQPEYLLQKYKTLQDVHSRQTRFGSFLLQYPIHRTVIYNRSFHVMSIRLINSLDEETRVAETEKTFLKRLKIKLLSRY